MRKIELKKERGITLIALVITIIVLLILAGVTIAALSGDNGILTKAIEAKKETEKAGALEKVQIEAAGSFDDDGKFNMDKLKDNLKENLGLQDSDIKDNPDGSITAIVDGYEITVDTNGNVILEGETTPEDPDPSEPEDPDPSEPEDPDPSEPEDPDPSTETAKPGEIVTGGNKEYTDETGTAIIPEGFAVVTDPDTINNGLVISDKPNDNMNNDAQGNQFVWVPVSKEDFETEFVRNDFGIQNIPSSNFINTAPEYNWQSSYYYEPDLNNTSGTTNSTKPETVAMYNSVKNNGGFYIARFESGVESEDTNRKNAVSKKGRQVFNYIGGCNQDNIAVDTGGAIEKARQMKPGHSTLCYGVQWDAIMRWISKDKTLAGVLTNSSNIGNYSRTLLPTGNGSGNQIKNIYDMAGNASEITMEIKDTWSRVTRGGKCSDSASNCPITIRDVVGAAQTGYDIGFRIALYV